MLHILSEMEKTVDLREVPELKSRTEQAFSLVAKPTDSNFMHHFANEEKQDLLKVETVFSDLNPSTDDCSRKSDANGSQRPNSSVATTHIRPLQSQSIAHNDGSDELVDVRVCDICGDAGREALLALCSTCSDGAEHIYCMRNKMDKVPESGWMCEECMELRELKNSSEVITGRAVSPLNPSCLEEFGRSLPKISLGVKEAAETSTNCLGKRHDPQIEMSSVPKKKIFGNGLSPPRSLCGGTKTQLTRNSSMSNMHMGKSAATKPSLFNGRPGKRAFEQAFLSGNGSPKIKKRICKGDISNRKTDDKSKLNMKVQQSKDDALPCVDTTKENADGKLEKVRNSKLFKSLSFAGSAPSSVSSVPSFNSSKLKDLKCKSGSGRNFTKEGDLPAKNNRPFSPSTSSRSMTVRSPRTKVASKTARIVPLSDKNVTQVCRDVKAQTFSSLSQGGISHANPLGGENLPSGHHSNDVNSDRGHKASHPTTKAELCFTVTDKNHHLASSGKVLHHELHPVQPMPTFAPSKTVLPGSSAVPAAECIWKGGFKMVKRGKLLNHCDGIQAHLSTCASSKVHEVASKFGRKLVLRESPRLEIWPTLFRSSYLTEQDIALYFFAEDRQSYVRSYKTLVDEMMEKDLVLEACFDGFQLIVLPSSLLPTQSQKWNSLYFLWGVCRVRKIDDRSLRLPGVDVATLHNNLCKSDTSGSPKKRVSTVEAEKSSPSHTFQAPEAADALLLLSSALTKLSDKSNDHDAISTKCSGAQEETDVQPPDTVGSVQNLKDDSFLCSTLPTDDMLLGIHCDDQEVKRFSKTDFFPSDKSYDENTVPLAINSIENRFYDGGFCRDPSIPLIYYPTSASRSSISVDSGPCGSSEGCAKSSDEAHGEHLERPTNVGAVNLDLCLGSPEVDDIDLDLVLGIPSRYQPKQRVIGGNNVDLNMSLALSL